jgi:hypothetical protein
VSRGLRDALLDVFGRGVDAPIGDAAFDRLALDVFRYQMEANPLYRAYSESTQRRVEDVRGWRAIPRVPTRAFKTLRLISGLEREPAAVFRTSGTTRAGARGTHYVLDLELYHASLLPNFSAHVLPDGIRPVLCALVPTPAAVAESSLAHMIGVVSKRLCAPGGRFFVDPDRGLDYERLLGALRASRKAGRPVLLAGTAFAFVHFLDGLAEEGRRVPLPEGSRVMVTGGYKGRSRTLEPGELVQAIESLLAVPAELVVAEYGMTEMLSQFYDPVLKTRTPSTGVFVGPPWVRTEVLDPHTLRPVDPGRPGLLAHVDLANLFSVASILTEDMGVAVEDGFRLLGRAEGSELRGCSLAYEAIASAGAATENER